MTTRSSTDSRWRGLFLACAAGAVLTAACIPLQVLLFIVWPPPASRDVADWFAIFNASPVRGLLSLDLVMRVEQVLLVPLVIALWVLLRRGNESLMALGAPLWLAGGFLVIGSNTAFEMLSLARSRHRPRAVHLPAGRRDRDLAAVRARARRLVPRRRGPPRAVGRDGTRPWSRCCSACRRIPRADLNGRHGIRGRALLT